MIREMRSVTLALLSAVTIGLWVYSANVAFVEFRNLKSNSVWISNQYLAQKRDLNSFYRHLYSDDVIAKLEMLSASNSQEKRNEFVAGIFSELASFPVPFSEGVDMQSRLFAIAEASSLEERAALTDALLIVLQDKPANGEPVVVVEYAGELTGNAVAFGAVLSTIALIVLIFHGRKRRKLELEMQELEVEEKKIDIERLRRTPTVLGDFRDSEVPIGRAPTETVE